MGGGVLGALGGPAMLPGAGMAPQVSVHGFCLLLIHFNCPRLQHDLRCFFIIIYFYRLSLLIRFWSWWRLWIQRESAMLVRYLCKRVFQSESDLKTCRLAGWTRWQQAWVWSQTLPTRKSRKPWRESERRSRSSRLRSSPAVSTSSPKHTTASFPSLFDKVQK